MQPENMTRWLKNLGRFITHSVLLDIELYVAHAMRIVHMDRNRRALPYGAHRRRPIHGRLVREHQQQQQWHHKCDQHDSNGNFFHFEFQNSSRIAACSPEIIGVALKLSIGYSEIASSCCHRESWRLTPQKTGCYR